MRQTHDNVGAAPRGLSQVRAALARRVACHTFRHSFATPLLDGAYATRTVQELLGHTDVRTTMIYTHVLKQAGRVSESG